MKRESAEPIARRIMGNKKIFARSFSREEQKRLACGAFVICFIMALNLSKVLKSYRVLPPNYFQAESTKPVIFNFSNPRSDVYEIKGDVRIHGTSSTIFISSSQNQNLSTWTIKPYAQKMNTEKFRRVTDFKIKMEASDRIPHCDRNLSNIPAIVFSGKGHSENHFHAFADVLFPLFLTSHQFNRTTMFLVTNHHPPWTSKYRAILQKLSKYDIYDIDREREVLCFSRMIVGLRAPKKLFMDPPSESAKLSAGNFTKLLRSAYSLKRESAHDRRETAGKISHPRMLIVSRGKSRRLMNEHELGGVARSLGFDVAVKRTFSNVSSVAKLVNSFDVMVGVHGAALTNMVFLPGDAVLIQIAPFGLELEAAVCFGWAARSMNLRYLEYRVSLNESSLLGKYPVDSEVYTDPGAVRSKSPSRFHVVYLDSQDVKLDLHRFRTTLLRALELLAA